MGKKLKKILSLVLVMSMVVTIFSACSSNKPSTTDPNTTPTVAPTGTTDGNEGENKPSNFTDISKKEITALLGTGWNLGNQLEAVTGTLPEETAWGNPVVTEDLIKLVKASGFTTIRVPVSYMGHIGDGPGYTVDSEWLDRIQQVVDYCINNGLYCIINMHGDGYQTIDAGWLYCDAENQEDIQAKYKAVWTQVADRFKDYDQHLIFESMNEVSDMSYSAPTTEEQKTYYKNINTYNQIFMDAIRQTGGNNDRRWVLIPGWNTEIEATNKESGFVIPTDNYLAKDLADVNENRTMISVHYYAPWAFCGGENGNKTQWGSEATNQALVESFGGQDAMALSFKSLYDNYTSKGYPVIVGEYGAIDKTKHDEQSNFYRAYFCKKLNENAKKYGCVPVYWDNGVIGDYGFGLFDRTNIKVTQQEIIDAIIGVYKEKAPTTGTATKVEFSETALSLIMGDTHELKVTCDTEDAITYTSLDESVAYVDSKGVIVAALPGKTTITATAASGVSATCEVTVGASEYLRVALYGIETIAWSNLESETVDIKPEGGTFTLKLKGTKEQLSAIGSMYLKDYFVQSAVTNKSNYSSVTVTIDSVKFNGVECPIKDTGKNAEAINANGQLDFCFVNEWADEATLIGGLDKTDEGHYYFTVADYKDENTVEFTFTVGAVVE